MDNHDEPLSTHSNIVFNKLSEIGILLFPDQERIKLPPITLDEIKHYTLIDLQTRLCVVTSCKAFIEDKLQIIKYYNKSLKSMKNKIVELQQDQIYHDEFIEICNQIAQNHKNGNAYTSNLIIANNSIKVLRAALLARKYQMRNKQK